MAPLSSTVLARPPANTAVCQPVIASGDRLGVAAVSAYHARPSAEVAMVFTHGMPLAVRWASMNSSMPVAVSMPKN